MKEAAMPAQFCGSVCGGGGVGPPWRTLVTASSSDELAPLDHAPQPQANGHAGNGVSTAPATRPPAPEAPFSLRAILFPMAAVILGVFMAILDTTVVNVALPTVGRVFAADLQILQWVITGYMLAQAAVIPLSGWLSDRFGAKRIFLIALVLFTLGSALCALATSAPMLVLFRVLQGLGGGMLLPVGFAFLYRIAPPERRGQVMSAFGVPMLLGPALGPVLSGYLLEFADWRLAFPINLPVGVVALVAGIRGLPILPAQRAVGALDLPGFVFGPLAFAALSYGISQSTAYGWTGTPTLLGIGVGAGALALFVARELSSASPLLELRVFRARDFTLAVLTQWVAVAGLFGTAFLVPLFLQAVRGYGAFETGLVSLPNALAAVVFMPIGGRLFDRYGARPTVMAGLAIGTIAMLLLARVSATTTRTDLIPPMLLWGTGLGLMMMPLGTHILNSAPRELVSRVTSLTSALQSLVASLAIASAATVLQCRTSTHLAESGAAAQPTPDALAIAQAAAFGDVYRTAMVLLIVAFLLAFTLRRRAGSPTAPRPTSEAPAMA
jgi:EmrB/QacA subfamily drug resistance transporter